MKLNIVAIMQDGISLAFAISEELIRLQPLCLFVTHYTQITALPQVYPTARNIHLKTTLGVLSDGITYLHSIGTGMYSYDTLFDAQTLINVAFRSL